MCWRKARHSNIRVYRLSAVATRSLSHLLDNFPFIQSTLIDRQNMFRKIRRRWESIAKMKRIETPHKDDSHTTRISFQILIHFRMLLSLSSACDSHRVKNAERKIFSLIKRWQRCMKCLCMHLDNACSVVNFTIEIFHSLRCCQGTEKLQKMQRLVSDLAQPEK